MQKKHTARKSRITQVKKDCDLQEFCALLRDLQARRVADKLNTTEQRALHFLKERIASEWAASSAKTMKEVNAELNEIIQGITPPQNSK